MTQSEGDQSRSVYRFRWLGYGLLLLALFDVIEVLVPPNFLNPVWEMQTIGSLVERIPVALLGLVLVFFGEDYDRTEWEDRLLKFVSWLCLLIGLLFLLMVPLGIVDTLRINAINKSQISAQLKQQLTELQQVEAQVKTGTPQDINNLVEELKGQNIQVDGKNPEDLKTQLLARLASNKQRFRVEAAAARADRRFTLLKSSVKWILGSVISSLLFLKVWGSTRWARRL